MRAKFLAVAAAALFAGPISAHAALILGNYPPTVNGDNSIGFGGVDFLNAVSVTSSIDQTLDSVTLRLAGYNSGQAAIVSLFSDLSGAPGSALVSLSTATAIPPFAYTDVTYTPTAAFNLFAGETYWLVVGGTSGGLGLATTTSALTGNSTGGIFQYSCTGCGWYAINPAYDAFAFSIEGSEIPVPEPGTLALFGLALGGIAVSRRRRAT